MDNRVRAVEPSTGPYRTYVRKATRDTPGVRRVGGVRLTVFWERMNGRFGEAYADSLARDLVIAQLGGRSVVAALEAGVDAAEVWNAVCEAVEVPAHDRH